MLKRSEALNNFGPIGHNGSVPSAWNALFDAMPDAEHFPKAGLNVGVVALGALHLKRRLWEAPYWVVHLLHVDGHILDGPVRRVLYAKAVLRPSDKGGVVAPEGAFAT